MIRTILTHSAKLYKFLRADLSIMFNKSIFTGAIDFRKNSLNTLKLIAALQVLYGHACVHLSYKFPKIVSQVFGIFMGVPIFFMLSGFLIWNSIGTSSNFKHYALKRFWRIYPELWVGVLVEILALLIFFKEKINYFLLVAFTFTQGSFLQFWTPDFLRNYGCGTPNGALWTICVTIQFYIIVWLLYKILHKKKIYWWAVAFAVAVLVKAMSPLIQQHVPEIVYSLFKVSILPYLWMFILGCFLAEFREKTIPFLKKFWWALIALSFVFSITKFDIDPANYGVFLYSLKVPGLIGLAYALPKINIKWDISYGLYIYHMTVINVMIELGFVGNWYHLLVAFSISILLACASTAFAHFLNKKIKLKKV